MDKQSPDKEPRTPLFSDYAREYLTSRGLRPTTVKTYQQLLDARLLPAFGDKRLGDITVADVKDWFTSQPAHTPSANASAYRVLRSIMSAAVADELITQTPVTLRKAGTAKVKRKAVPATVEELHAIVAAMPVELQLLIVIAAFCGLREGELFELRRSDIDPVEGTISVTRQVAKDRMPHVPGACPNCERPIGPPKTEAGTRVVYLPPMFMPMLKTHLNEHTARQPDALLFPGVRTDHMSARYLHDRYKTARNRAGRPDLTIHHLRHTALTLAGQQGATAAELKHRAGHSSHAAMAIYQHSNLDRDRMLAGRISDAVADNW